MPDLSATLWEHALAAAQGQVRKAVRQRYFPEIWYAVENWFQQLRGRRVLEVGYGIGLVGQALAKSGWDVTCTDPQAATLSDLRESFDKQHLRATFVECESTHLPFPDASFDAVALINSLEFTSSPLTSLREVKRVLKPAGRAVVASFNRHGPWGVPAILQAVHKPPQDQETLLLTKQEFLFIMESAGLHVDRLTERACYPPLALPVKIRLPVAGAYVALIHAVEARQTAAGPSAGTTFAGTFHSKDGGEEVTVRTEPAKVPGVTS